MRTNDKMKLGMIAYWMGQKEATLKSLYNDFKSDTGDTKTDFTAFCFFMYDKCKHSKEWVNEAKNYVTDQFKRMEAVL